MYERAKELIVFFEGRRKEAYSDTGGVWTIGIGSTKNVKLGMKITDAEIDERWEEDLHDAIIRVDSIVNVVLTEHEKCALISQAFNLKSFGKLAGYVNEDKELYKKKMLLYCKDIKGNWLKGLKIRRIAERLLFENREWLDFAKWAQQKSTTISMILGKETELFKQPGE